MFKTWPWTSHGPGPTPGPSSRKCMNIQLHWSFLLLYWAIGQVVSVSCLVVWLVSWCANMLNKLRPSIATNVHRVRQKQHIAASRLYTLEPWGTWWKAGCWELIFGLVNSAGKTAALSCTLCQAALSHRIPSSAATVHHPNFLAKRAMNHPQHGFEMDMCSLQYSTYIAKNY